MSESEIAADSVFVPYKIWRLSARGDTMRSAQRAYLVPGGQSAPIHLASMAMGEVKGRPRIFP